MLTICYWPNCWQPPRNLSDRSRGLGLCVEHTGLLLRSVDAPSDGSNPLCAVWQGLVAAKREELERR